MKNPPKPSLMDRWEGAAVSSWRARWGVPELEVHESVGSTSDRLRVLAAGGAEPWTVVLAEEQTRGRGRSGDVWHSPPGAGLWLSTLVPVEPAPAPCLPLLVGLAAAGALEEAAGVEVGIKWPNDLVAATASPRAGKLGGILCEGGGRLVLVGVGINARTPEEGFPPELAGVATSVEEMAGRSVDRGRLATELLARLRGLEDRSAGMDRLTAPEREELARRDVLAGRRVVSAAGEGTARGVDERGALRVERDDGEVVGVVAGSVRPADET